MNPFLDLLPNVRRPAKIEPQFTKSQRCGQGATSPKALDSRGPHKVRLSLIGPVPSQKPVAALPQGLHNLLGV